MEKPIIVPSRIQETLTGSLLVATPQLQDDFFARVVIYMSSHDKEGAMGFIVNTAIEQISIHDILDQLQMMHRIGDRNLPVMLGGPVEPHRGFILHDGDYLQPTAISAKDGITATANSAVLTGWLEGAFTAKAMLVLGYAGWTAGQLEAEIEQGSWVSVPATRKLLFDTPHEQKWDVAITSLGFDMGNYSTVTGHA